MFGVSLALALIESAVAEELTWVPRVDFGLMNYEAKVTTSPRTEDFGSRRETSTFSEFKYQVNAAPFVGIGLSAFYDNWFLDLSGLRTASTGADPFSFNRTITITDTTTGNELGSAVILGKGNVDFQRSEAALSLGYALFENTALYAGYKWAHNDFDGKLKKADASSPDLDFNFSYKEQLEYDGPFIGGTYVWPFPELKGGLTFNGALAYLQGTVTDKSRQISPIATGTLKTSYDGDSLGLTLGVSWQGRTSVQGLGYSLGISGYNYKFDADCKADQSCSDFTERAFLLKGGVSYQF